jgi:hypothetical protein
MKFIKSLQDRLQEVPMKFENTEIKIINSWANSKLSRNVSEFHLWGNGVWLCSVM